jgi:ribonuclease R
MLPETLSNGICSLKPKVDRMCFVCDMQIDSRRPGHQVEVLRSGDELARAPDLHAGVERGRRGRTAGGARKRCRRSAQLPQVQRLHQLYQVLKKARAKRGAIEFESSEVRFVLGPQGEVTQAGMLQRNDAHKLIEECMIAANVEAARYILKKKIPAPFRVHDKPPEAEVRRPAGIPQGIRLKMPPWAKVSRATSPRC